VAHLLGSAPLAECLHAVNDPFFWAFCKSELHGHPNAVLAPCTLVVLSAGALKVVGSHGLIQYVEYVERCVAVYVILQALVCVGRHAVRVLVQLPELILELFEPDFQR